MTVREPPPGPRAETKSHGCIDVIFSDQAGKAQELAGLARRLKDSLAVAEVGFVGLQFRKAEPTRNLALLHQAKTEEVEGQLLIHGPLQPGHLAPAALPEYAAMPGDPSFSPPSLCDCDNRCPWRSSCS